MASASTRPLRSPAQNNAIWGLLSRIATASGLDRDDLKPLLHDICVTASGQGHTSALTGAQAQVVIGRLERELATYTTSEAKPAGDTAPKAAPHAPWGPRGPGARDERRITHFQNVVIDGLFTLCGFDSLERRQGFCKRQVQKTWPETMKEADALIQPLAEMGLRKVDKADVERRVVALRNHPGLDRWKVQFIDDLCEKYTGANRRTVLTPFRLIKILECEAAIAPRVSAGGANVVAFGRLS